MNPHRYDSDVDYYGAVNRELARIYGSPDEHEHGCRCPLCEIEDECEREPEDE